MAINRLFFHVCALPFALVLPLSLQAATETVNGIEWTYTVTDGKASVGSGDYYGACAIPSTTTGAITIPSSLGGCPVTSIAEHAFRYCGYLTSVTIPNSVTSIGDVAFGDCRGLESVSMPNSLTSVGEGVFYNCRNLTSVHMSDLAAWCGISFGHDPIPHGYAHLFLNGKEVTELTIPDSVTRIGDWAFSRCKGLASVTIPDSVTNIGSAVFYYCSSLASVTIGNGVTSIGGGSFSECSSLTTFVVGANNPAYKSVNNLLLSKNGKALVFGVNGDVTIPDSVTSIENEAFVGRRGLTSLTIPSSVTHIESFAFCRCSGLASLTIPNSVTSIGWCAFGSCTGLASLTIPSSVTYVGRDVFQSCSGLKMISIPYHLRNQTREWALSPGCRILIRAVVTYIVKFNANGGKLPKGRSMAAQKMTYGKAAALRKNGFTRSGCVFLGWAKSKNGAVAYKNGQSVKNLRADGKTTTLYAVWAKKTYKVKFVANGGKGKMAVQKMKYGTAKKLPANKFKRKGYVFKGWAKSKADAKRGKVSYKNKKKVKNLDRNGKTVKLYAVWKS